MALPDASWAAIGTRAAGVVLEGVEASAEANMAKIIFQSGHASRHLSKSGPAAGVVEKAIRQQILADMRGASVTGSFWGKVPVDNVQVLYRAFTVRSGLINVETYYPVP